MSPVGVGSWAILFGLILVKNKGGYKVLSEQSNNSLGRMTTQSQTCLRMRAGHQPRVTI